MERKIGEIISKTYKVIPSLGTCNNCAFNNGTTCLEEPLKYRRGRCAHRKDKKSVIFVKLNDMEIKNNQLIIEAPEGMEIDVENSDLTKSIIRFKNKKTTYVDIEDALNLEGNRTAVAADVNNVSKLSALDKLMNIARYYNKGWKPNWSNSEENKHCIKFDYHKDTFYVVYNNSTGAGDVFFKNSEDARAVINNHNFRDILDTIYKN